MSTPPSPSRLLIAIANDKGGVGKSLLAAELIQLLSDGRLWDLVEIEQRQSFSQDLYDHPATVRVHRFGLLHRNPTTSIVEPSLAPFADLLELIPKDEKAPSRILLDFGSSTFQSYMLWGGPPSNQLRAFKAAGYKFIHFIPVQARDKEGANFFNQWAPPLCRLGPVVLVQNDREGLNYSLVKKPDPVHVLRLTHRGYPLAEILQRPEKRLTFKQVSELPVGSGGISKRAQRDADLSLQEFTQGLNSIREQIGLP